MAACEQTGGQAKKQDVGSGGGKLGKTGGGGVSSNNNNSNEVADSSVLGNIATDLGNTVNGLNNFANGIIPMMPRVLNILFLELSMNISS